MAGTTPPDDLDLAGEWTETVEGRSTKERVYEVATSLTEPARVAEIAERADCSPGGARSNLEWLATMGVVERVAEDPALYRRNEAYFDFLRVHRLTQEYDAAELEALIEEYEARERELADSFDADTPEAVDLSSVPFGDLDEAYDRAGEWRVVRRRLREFRRALLALDEEGGEPLTA